MAFLNRTKLSLLYLIKITNVGGSGIEFVRSLTSSIVEKLLNASPIPLFLLPVKEISIRVMSLRSLKPNAQISPDAEVTGFKAP